MPPPMRARVFLLGGKPADSELQRDVMRFVELDRKSSSSAALIQQGATQRDRICSSSAPTPIEAQRLALASNIPTILCCSNPKM